MLFDLRSKGRRTAIKFIYAGLAILMAGGLIFFGIGGSVSGGLLDAFKNDTKSTSDVFKGKLETAQKRVDANPRDASAWANLARVRYQAASAGSGFDQTTGVFTAEGRKDLQKVETAWNRYLALKPEKVDERTAQLMVQAFGPAGLAQYDKAVGAMEAVLEARPDSVGLYVQYAQLAYLAGQDRKGDLAAKKAESLAPAAQRAQVKASLEQAKKDAAQQAVQSAQQQTG
jgi:hypothetical protein